ncbi:Site-specific DNA recombinase [Flaviramulus basaltis]|uniref:Site-specific DNA recombinase n=1 Tax=Flaviramulus basaltis TaxID=369401 RepID=A0A1K2IPV5_9FLAO|nr:recombinase family protein [Flaviramulus basaltis]SFZ94415.1 Site-specific DNA recombinase [Flaviramulus basaltis]
MKARYVRISTASQKIERQLIKNHPNEKLFVDISSGAIAFNKREKAKELLGQIKNNEVKYVSVHSIDRLGRNLYDILYTLETFEKFEVILKVDNLGLESHIAGKPNFAFKLIISVMGSIAEMERETLLERQREGITIAKINGVYKGRLKGSKESKSQFLLKHKNTIKYLNQNHSLRNVAKLCNISLSTVQKVKELYSKNDITKGL